jgi:uncharacterized protein
VNLEVLNGRWPFWLGALALAVTAVGYAATLGRLLGVSGIYERLIYARSELATEREERGFRDRTALEEALRRETLAEMERQGVPIPPAELAAPVTTASSGPAMAPRVPLWGQLVFLLMMFAGGALAKALAGGLSFESAPDPTHAQLFGRAAPLALVLGGLLVGFGTRMAGGCTSGHGLSGCGRLQPGSLLATACFFGSGVALSMVLARVLV